MSETIYNRIEKENTQLVRGRVFAAIVGLGGRVEIAGFSQEQLIALSEAGKGSNEKTLRKALVVDLGFAKRTGMQLGKELTSAANDLLNKNLKGGE